jgi:Yip1 domain
MNIVERAKNMIMKPTQEWQVIDGETHTVKDLYVNYAMILAAIPAVAKFIGFSIVGLGGLLSQYRIPIASGVALMVVGYVLSLASVYVLALIIDGLAPNFGSQKNFLQALKLAVFSMTAAWLAGIFSLLPALSILGLLGLYSLYVLYLGMPVLMKTPADKLVPYFVVVLIAAIVVHVVIGALAALTIPGSLRGF